MYRIGYQLNLNHTTTWCMEKLHFHESIEILLCLSDGGVFYIDNCKYNIQNGSLFILKGAILHRSMSNGRYKRYVMHISFEELERLSTAKSNFISCVEAVAVHTLLDSKTRDALTEKFAALLEREEETFGGDLLKNMQLVDVLVTVFQSAAYTTEPMRKDVNPVYSKAEDVIKYIQEHYSEPLTLDSIANVFYLNKYYLCHLFKTATGLGVMEYIIKCRITKARDLLRRGYRVYEVGEMVGFRNNSHFIRTFRRLTGVSPKLYANQYMLSTMKEAGEIFLETAGDLLVEKAKPNPLQNIRVGDNEIICKEKTERSIIAPSHTDIRAQIKQR